MASHVPVDDNSNTKSEEGTMAFHKKRARRVSFAENTSVHIFDRDEDSGTPLDPKPPSSPSDELGSAERNHEPSRLFWNVDEDDNDNNNEDDDDEPGSRSPFLRIVGSPSSGGSTICSANSNDEDNFFGPVSSSFLRRDLMDAAASDANHDHTMDSTFFSMHFRSIARSESEVELKTSTGVHLPFEEKTPTTDSVPTNTKTPMLMTLAKKQIYQPPVSPSKLSTKSESNDMSIVGEYNYNYDYEEPSPTFDPLMAEGNKNLHVIAPSNFSILKSPRITEPTKANGTNLMDFRGDEDNCLHGIIGHEVVNEVASLEPNGLGVVNDGSTFSPSKKIASGIPPQASNAEVSKHLSPRSSIMVTPTANTKDVVKDAFQIKSSLDFSAIGQGNPNPKNTIYSNDVIGKERKSPFVGDIPYKSPSYVTPSNKHSSVFVRTESQEHAWSLQSIQKSISKLGMLEASPFSDAMTAKLQDSIIKSVTRPSKMTPLNSLLEKNYKSPLLNSVKDSGHLSSPSQNKRTRESSTNMDNIKLNTPKFVENSSPLLIPPESTRSGEKLQNSSADIRHGYKDDKNTMGVPQSSDFSPQKRLKIVNTTEFKSGESVTNASLSTEEEMVDIREVFPHEVHCDPQTKGNPTTLLTDEEHEKFQVSTKFMGSDIASEKTNGDSPVVHEGTDRQSCKKNLHDQFCQSPSKEQRKVKNGMVEITVETQKSPKGNVVPELSSDHGIPKIAHNFKNPSEINELLSNEMKELLSKSVDKLNLQTIDSMAGIVDQLLMSKTYQLLSDNIQSQKSVDISKDLPHKRASETKLLLAKFLHEKAKLQLMQVKREKLLKSAKSLASGILESEELKSKFLLQKSPDVSCGFFSKDLQDLQTQIDGDKMTSRKEELNQIDRKIDNLTKSFHKSCKMKEELSSSDTTTFVNNYLKKEACRQIIRKGLQLFTVDNLKSRNGCHSVDLNYLDLMTQRFMINDASLFILHELNNVNINKIFKDMEACTAFRFVFNGETIQKHVNATSLAQETQVTGCCFGNLFDVVEEIQHSRIELKNLISIRFHTPLDDQLDLELCFFDSKHRRKATVTLNLSCLGRGIYPSEIISTQIHVLANEPQKSSPKLASEIAAALEDLKTGYLRIQRLCRCISNLISPPIR